MFFVSLYCEIYLAAYTCDMNIAILKTYIMRIIIFANGDLPNLEKARTLLRPDDFILCADGGTRHALALGLTPNVIVGDMDSLPANFQTSTFDGEIVLYPKDKNETDLELAIDHAVSLNPDQILILAALGGRMDQTLANIALLSNLQLATCVTLNSPTAWKKSSFAEIRPKLKEEAETSSHSSPGREKSQASSPKICAGIFITKRSTPIKRAASATK